MQRPAANLAPSQGLRAWALGEGVLMLVLGLLAVTFPIVASLWVARVVALMFLLAGLCSWIHTLGRARHLSGPHAF